MTSFTIFTLFISYIVKIFPINPNSLRLAATFIIGLLGLSMLIPSLGARFEVFINNLFGPLQSRFKKEGSGFGGGLSDGFFVRLGVGTLRGAYFSDDRNLVCDTIGQYQGRGHNPGLCFRFGDPLYIFSSFSAGLFKKMRRSINIPGIIQQGFGLIMIITAILIYTNYAQVIQAKVLNLFPGYSRFLGQFENNGRLQKELDNLAGRKAQTCRGRWQAII